MREENLWLTLFFPCLFSGELGAAVAVRGPAGAGEARTGATKHGPSNADHGRHESAAAAANGTGA